MNSTKEAYKTCSYCSGQGRKTRLQSYGAFNGFVRETCRHCNGKGKVKK